MHKNITLLKQIFAAIVVFVAFSRQKSSFRTNSLVFSYNLAHRGFRKRSATRTVKRPPARSPFVGRLFPLTYSSFCWLYVDITSLYTTHSASSYTFEATELIKVLARFCITPSSTAVKNNLILAPSIHSIYHELVLLKVGIMITDSSVLHVSACLKSSCLPWQMP